MKVSIVIPHFNGFDALKKTLEALFASTFNDFEVLVVDNNSSDESIQRLQKEFPDVHIYSLKSNIGFAGGSNYGALQSRADLLLFLNNDCIIEKNTLQKLHKYLEDNSKIIATQPIVLDTKGNIENIGYVVDMTRAKAKVVTSLKDVRMIVNEQKTKAYIYGLSATCLLIKKDIFMKIGMFDESFHSYLEDVDMCVRLHLQGYRYAPCLTTSCIHYHMTTSSKMGLYKEKRDFINWIRIIAKNYPVRSIMINFPQLFIERLRNLNGILKKGVSRIFLLLL